MRGYIFSVLRIVLVSKIKTTACSDRFNLKKRAKNYFRLTAIIFSLIPPTGNILPVSEISPVIAKFSITGLFKAKDSRVVTTVHPADGPSLGVAP